jgi:ABC-type nitrate/sulfonate/bicarbonate transport system permease component
MTRTRRTISRSLSGLIPFAAILLFWWLAPSLFNYPPYMLPTVADVARRFGEIVIRYWQRRSDLSGGQLGVL